MEGVFCTLRMFERFSPARFFSAPSLLERFGEKKIRAKRSVGKTKSVKGHPNFFLLLENSLFAVENERQLRQDPSVAATEEQENKKLSPR